MPVYEYKALNPAGKLVRGIVDADDMRSARTKLRKAGIFPTELREDTVGKRGARQEIRFTTLLHRVKPQDVALMVRQLSTLTVAGLPLVESLTALIEQVDHPYLKRVITQVREKVNEGSTLADALAEHPRIFSPLAVNMIRAGEASGALDIVLLRLADFTESQVALRNKIWAAMTYPILMTFVGSGVLFFLLTFVIPVVTQIFQDMEQSLPLVTRVLIGVSTFLQRYWWLLLVGILTLVFAARKYRQTEAGSLLYDKLKLRFPVFGPLFQKVAISRFSRTLSILLDSGITLLTALDIVKAVMNNKVLAAAVEEARKSISEGQDIASPLRRSQLFPPLVVHMIAVGEKSGKLEEMLRRIAESYDNEVEATVQGLTSILEPFMILVMGAVVGFIVLSILLPIFEMNQIVR
ncbi:MAG: type II secretion system protein GspF [Nitrospinota bacterium]|nr:MAG: type II secretion system protein GspF [Nitrospinota bacterium]